MKDVSRDIWAKIQRSKVEFQDEISQPPLTDKGRIFDAFTLDPFRKFGQRLFNPEKIRPETFELMKKDPQIAAALRTINETVISPSWDIIIDEDGIDSDLAFINDNLKILDLRRYLRESLSAIGIGYHVAEKVWEEFRDDSGNLRKRMIKLKSLPPKSIEFDVRNNGDLIRVIQSTNTIETSSRAVERISGRLGTPAISAFKEIRFTPNKVSVYTFWDGLSVKFGNFHGSSLLVPAYKVWFYKEWIERHQNRYLELVAGGILVANAGRGSQTKLGMKINMLKSNANITLKEGQKLELIKPQQAGSAFLEWINYLDSQITKVLGVPVLLLGQNSKFGSRSLSDTHFKSFQQTTVKPVQGDLEGLSNAIFKQIIEVNFGHRKSYPRLKFRISSIEEAEKIMNFTMKGFKTGIFGMNDIQEARSRVGWPSGDPGERMDMRPSSQDGGGSAGDQIIRDTDAGSNEDNDVGGNEELTARIVEAMFEELANNKFTEFNDRLDEFLSQVGDKVKEYLDG